MASAGWRNETGRVVDQQLARSAAVRSRRGCRTARPGPGPRARPPRAPRPGTGRTRRRRAWCRGRDRSRGCAACRRRVAAPTGPTALARPCSRHDVAEHQLDDPFLGALRATSTTPTVSPSRSTVARSQTAAISIIRCEMKMTDRSGPAPSADDLEHALGEVRRQRRGHLVEHEDVGLDRQGAREVDDAQRRERQVPCGCRAGPGSGCRAPPASARKGSTGVRVRRRLDAMSRSGTSDGSW